jgi:hypothetical protein
MATCRNYPTARRKQPFDESEAADLRARIKQEERFNRQLAQSPLYQNLRTTRANLQQSVQNEWLQMTGDLTRLSTRNLTSVNDFLASMFGIKNWAGLSTDAYSVAGQIRSSIVKSQKVAANQIMYAGRMLAGRRLANVTNKLEQLLPTLTKERRAEVLYDTLTVGMIPRRRSLQSQFRSAQKLPQTAADVEAAKAFTKYEQEMSAVGISGRDLDEVLTLARDVSNSFEHMAIAASAQGVEVGRLDDLGYLPAVLTDDAALRVKAADGKQLLDVKLGNELTLATLHNVSRKTSKYVPEDSALASRLLGISETELNDLLLDPQEWVQFLRANVTTDQLDLMVDSGVLGKLPMASREVFDYMRTEYKLPYDELNQLYVTDVNVLMSRYSESLMRSVNSTSLINTLLTPKAFDAGWVVTREMAEQGGDYANFVPISNSFADLAQASKMSIQQLAANIGVDAAMVERLSSTYVHPQVARQWRSILAVSVNPSAMASFGSQVLALGRMVNKMVLTNVQFVARQAYQSVRVNTAAGGSVFTLPHATLQINSVLNDGITPGLFSDAKVFMRDGEAISERRLFEYFIKEEGASSVPGMVSERVVSRPADINKLDLLVPNNVRTLVQSVFTNPRSIARAFSNMLDYTMAHGDVLTGRKVSLGERVGRFSEYAINSFRNMVDDNYVPYATYAIAAETAAKWNVYRTVTAKVSREHEVLDSVQQLVSAGQVTRYDRGADVSRHLAEYFVDPFDTGRVNSFINHYVRPFSTYAMANPPMQLRHAMRHPHLYLAGERLHTMVNQPLLTDEGNNEYTIPGWISEQKPWYVGRAANGVDPIMLLPQNFDSGTDAFVFFNELGEDVRRLAFGEVVGTPEERNAVLSGANTQNFINEMASMLHAPWKVIIEQITGSEFFSGRSIELGALDKQRVLAGFRINARIAHFLENAFPAVRMFDSLNPLGVLGAKPERDAFGNLVNPGRLSIRGTERQRTDEFAADTETDNAALRYLRLAGLNIRQLNYDKTYYRSYADLERTSTEMLADLNRAKKTLREDASGLNGVIDSQELKRRIDAYTAQSTLLTRLYIDTSRLRLWGEARGLPPAEALEQLRTLKLNLQSLPVPEVTAADSQMALDRLREDAVFVRGLLERR